jgi:endoglucanase
MTVRSRAGWVVGLLLAMDLGGVAALASQQSNTSVVDPLAAARQAASSFLSGYETSSGRVVRWDQGGDTVSEGQGYAMLLAAATGDGSHFGAAWQWDKTHLQEPDGLFAWHWANGSVVSTQPATDADLDTAWALLLAARSFGQPSYRSDALRIGSAILANETTMVDGRLQLVAGTWARTSPATVNPSYAAPAALSALGSASGDGRWAELEAASLSSLAALQSGGHLPPDWATLGGSGVPQPEGTPGTGSVPAFGLDAQRSPVWSAGSCVATARSLAGQDWGVLAGAAGGGRYIAYTLSGGQLSSFSNPLGLVAAAAAAAAAGQVSRAAGLLAQASSLEGSDHTYYGDAWVALGRVLLDTDWLTGCPAVG